jgi:hypothetical protein
MACEKSMFLYDTPYINLLTPSSKRHLAYTSLSFCVNKMVNMNVSFIWNEGFISCPKPT